jgi:hypothetical protein
VVVNHHGQISIPHDRNSSNREKEDKQKRRVNGLCLDKYAVVIKRKEKKNQMIGKVGRKKKKQNKQYLGKNGRKRK